jgi:hypothetical protein
MNLSKIKATVIGLMISVLVLYPSTAFAGLPIRHNSDVGASSNAANWNLFGPSLLFPDGEVSTYQEVICTGGVASEQNDDANAGGCEGGSYLWVYQFTSTKTNVVFSLTGMKGFTFNENSTNPDEATVGVIQCDTSGSNTTGLCTTLTTSGPTSTFPAITFTHNATSVSFHIPSIPAYPAGTGTQGQGLTVFVVTQQSSAIPVAIPKPN